MSLDATSSPDYGILSYRFMTSGQWDRALSTAQEWLAKDPQNLQAHRVAAQSLINLDRESEAEVHAEKVLAGNPNDDFTHRLLSMVYFKKEWFKQADESIRKAISLNPKAPYHWHHLAVMSFNQGDLATARKAAEKARELSPDDANIRNLAILCGLDGAKTTLEKIRLYEEALELDPENAAIHNNIGVQYLHNLQNYTKAEECFRRALFFDPTLKLARKNLFLTVKRRDAFYRGLCLPKDFLVKIMAELGKVGRSHPILHILMIPVWLLAIRFILGGLILWLLLFWPLIKVYEYLTIGDLRAKTGEIEARRGGFLGYRKWSLRLRMGLFGLCLVSFWGFCAWELWRSDSGEQMPEWLYDLLCFAFVIAFFVFVFFWFKRMFRRHREARAAKRRAKLVGKIFEPAEPKRPWWQFFRGRTKSE